MHKSLFEQTKNNNIFILFLLLISAASGSLVAVIRDFSILVALIGVILFFLSLLLVYLFFDLAFIGYFIALFGFYDLLGKFPIISSPIKIYLADGILVFILVILLKMLFSRTYHSFPSSITNLLLINFAIGVILMLVSFYMGNNAADIFGAFRRYYVYPLSAFVAIFFIRHNRNHLQKLKIPSMLVLAMIVGTIAFRLVTNQSWWGSYYQEFEEVRAMGYFTGVILIIAFSIYFGLSLVRATRNTVIMSIILFVCLLLSNWRLLWFFAFLLLFITPILTLSKKRKLFKAYLIVIGFILLVLLALVILQFLIPSWFDSLFSRFSDTIVNFDLQSDVRFWAWKSAFEKIQKSPLLGYGLGHPFSFMGMNSLGQFVTYNLGVHNIILDLLYQTGIVGTLLFLVFQLKVFFHTLKKIPKLNTIEKILTVGLFMGFLGELCAAMVQSALRVPTDVVAFYMIVGFLIGDINVSKLKKLQPSNNPICAQSIQQIPSVE